jgi:hypothetical protein
MKKLFLFVFFIFSLRSVASHIVGGEIQMTHLSGNQYNINLLLYFDEHNGSPSSKDPQLIAKIFRNSNNVYISDLYLILINEKIIDNSQSDCLTGSFAVSQLTYSATMTLDPEIYSDPGGYYIAWERCCRNFNISNIYSSDPNTGGQAAGATFFLQFPPVTKNGDPFENSSPVFKEPTIDVACTNRIFFVDFSATDPDGDSLVYSIATPLSTHSSEALPIIGPKPYPEVVWRDPFNLQHIMSGNPDLSISKKGLITVVPSYLGEFVFSITCEEYRDGIKIGEVRRDYEILVQDCNPGGVAPVIKAKSLSGSYSDAELNVSFDNEVTDLERCIKVSVEDGDIFTTSSSTQQISIQAIPIGFDQDISGFLPEITTLTIDQENPVAEFSICFDRCSPIESNDFTIGIVAYDNGCSIALTDTIKVNISLALSPGCKFQTIDFPAIPDRTFGDDPFPLNATSSSGLPVNFLTADESLASITSSIVSLHKSGRATITATQSGDETYRSAPSVKRSFCINPTAPVITLGSSNNDLLIISNNEEGNLWYKNGILLAETIDNKILITDETASYTVRAITDDCVSTESNTILIAGVNDKSVSNTAEVYPNPADNFVVFRLPGNATNKRIDIFGINGNSSATISVDEEIFSFNIGHFPSGVYFAKIRNGNGLTVKKIFKK